VSSLEQSSIGPSHYEVTMETISSRIAICKSKFEIREETSCEVELKENGEDGNRVRFRADTTVIITIRRVRHVTLVVSRVHVFTIPAGREVDLSSQLVALFVWQSVVTATLTVAHNGNSAMGKIRLIEGASRRVTSNHSETIRRSHRRIRIIWILDFVGTLLNPGCVRAGSELIVNGIS